MQKKHKLNLTRKAAGDLEDLSDLEYERILKGCQRLESDPSPDGMHVKKLQGYKDLYRLRIGDYRIVFQLTAEGVTMIRVLTRQDFGKKF